MISRLVRPFVCRHWRCLLATAGMLFLYGTSVTALAADAPPLEDLPQAIPRDETAADRVEAAAYFAAARTAEQRGEIVSAIRSYQRCLRRDPDAHTVVQSLVSLLCELDRQAEAARYVLKSDTWCESDVLMLRRLGVYLTGQGQWKEAIAVYRLALSARGAPKGDSADLLLAMEMGRLYQLDEQYKQAVIEFDRVLELIDGDKKSAMDEKFLHVLLGDEGVTYGLMGDCYLMAERFDDAVRLFRRSYDASPDVAVLRFNESRVLMGQGKAREAIALLDQALAGRITGEGTAPYELLAEALRAVGRPQEIVSRLENLYAADAKNYPLAFALAQAHQSAGAAKKAEPLLVGLMEVRPSPTVFRSLVRLLRTSGDMDRLMKLLGETAERVGVLDFLGAEAQTLASDEPTLRSLEDAAHRLLTLPAQGNNHGLASAAAVLMLEGKRYGAAGKFFEAAIAARPEKEAEMLLVWGVGLLLGEQYPDAAAVLKRCVEAKGKDHGGLARFYLAAALIQAGQGGEAVAVAQQACAARPDSARFAARLGWVCYQNKQVDEAERHYRGVVDRFGTDRASRENCAAVREARMALSNICWAQGRTAEAEEWLEQVLDAFPDHPAALNDLGYLWADRSMHLKIALPMVQRAVAAEPDNVAFRDSLGWALFRLGRMDEAVSQLRAAAEKQPSGTILEHLGDAQAKAGRARQASEAWSAAASRFDQEDAPAKAKAVRRKIAAAEGKG